MDGGTNETKFHPFCNLTTNKELSSGKGHEETFHYYLPTTWLVCRVFFLVVIAALVLLVGREIVLYIVYQKRKGKKAIEMLLLHHFQLPKLIFLFISAVLRWTWFLDPYFVEGKYNMFASTYADWRRVYNVLLRLPQFFLFLVILLQIKSWRQTVRNTSKLRRTGGRRRTVRSSITAKDLPAVRTDNIVITLFILVLLVATILNIVLFPLNVFLTTAALLILLLIPAGIYYVYKLRLLILSLYKGKNSNQRKPLRAIQKIKRIAKCMIAVTFGGVTLFVAAIYNNFIDQCKKGKYREESIKYLIFVILIHLMVEIVVMVAMFYTLYTKKEHANSTSTKMSNKYASSTGETDSRPQTTSMVTTTAFNSSSLSRVI